MRRSYLDEMHCYEWSLISLPYISSLILLSKIILSLSLSLWLVLPVFSSWSPFGLFRLILLALCCYVFPNGTLPIDISFACWTELSLTSRLCHFRAISCLGRRRVYRKHSEYFYPLRYHLIPRLFRRIYPLTYLRIQVPHLRRIFDHFIAELLTMFTISRALRSSHIFIVGFRIAVVDGALPIRLVEDPSLLGRESRTIHEVRDIGRVHRQ